LSTLPTTIRPPAGDVDGWRSQVDEENKKRVEAMTDEEREQERREILERFGPSVGEILRRAKEARETRERVTEKYPEQSDSQTISTVKPENIVIPASTLRPASPPSAMKNGSISRSSSPPSAMSRGGSRPSSRADRNVRFADVTPNDIHVYVSAPPSPRKQPLALLSPTAADGPTISLGEWKSKTGPFVRRRDSGGQESSSSHAETIQNLEEGTPEDIRRRFFPDAPAHDPSLAWIESDSASTHDLSSATSLRFDLTGTPIPAELSSTLPTHLGLHHHADGNHAGYTLEDLFLLSRSTVPAQRATMLGVLGLIVKRLAKACKADADSSIKELAGQEDELRKRILAAGVEAMSERGSLGARAVEVMWECIVGWDEEVMDIEGVELHDSSRTSPSPSPDVSNSTIPKGDALASLPLEYVLSQISSAFASAALPTESLVQLLSILHRLAQHSNEIASTIVATAGLVSHIVQGFLLTPIPPTDDSPLPDPFALQLLTTLALASRANASTLLGPADALLRFVTTLPPSSPYSLSLATALLTGTLRLYTAFASYGLYSHIATTASEHFTLVNKYVLSQECRSNQLKTALLGLLEAWIVCARDPHRTTPSHEILWSQVAGWSWGEDALELRKNLTEQDSAVLSALWRMEAAWLEGARVNSARAGEEERTSVILAVKEGFESGTERAIIGRSMKTLNEQLSKLGLDGVRVIRYQDLPLLQQIAHHAGIVASALRLWISCLSAQQSGISETQLPLPLSQLSDLAAQITLHPIWASIFVKESLSYAHAFCRPLSNLLASYLRLSRRLADTTDDLWMAQAFTILCRLMPGDEEVGRRILEDAIDLVTPDFMNSRRWPVPTVLWDKGGLAVVKPFLSFSLRPKEDLCVGPIWISPESISSATTQRLPPSSSINPDTRRSVPLPLSRDWMFSPLDHLLRSGESEVFKTMPTSWDASETEVVRATLLLARVVQAALPLHGLDAFLMSREETVFACMKVFMLEHEQQHNSSSEEVFQDSIVGRYMEELLAPFAAGVSMSSLLLPYPASSEPTLERVGARFLGPSTPFYQFYTDFVALYDAISFAHPLFARLLLPPLSTRYALDYRKYLWADYAHVLRTIRTPIDAVITASVGEYLWPVEKDAQVIGSYLRALVRGTLDGFLRFLAVHHIACTIWPDLGGAAEDKAGKLLRAVVEQAGLDFIREVVCYRQVTEGTILTPPHCFVQSGDWRASRLQFIERVGSDSMKERLRKLLEQD